MAAGIVFGVLAILLFFKFSYTVVPPHEAHVVVKRGKGMQLFSSREIDGRKQSSYFYVPLLHRRSILPLRNKQLYIENIPLRDKDLAKFICDVVCWINIKDPVKAAERIGSQERIKDFTGIEDDIKNLIKAVTRNSSMKMDLVRLMSERLEFSKRIADEVAESLPEFGVSLVDLECIHFIDQEPYTVVSDLEKRQSAQINSTTRKLVAEKTREAEIAESDNQRLTELTKAKNEEEFKKRQIERDEELGKADQKKTMEVERSRQQANKQLVEAEKTKTVGLANVTKEATIVEAEGEAEAVYKKGEAEARVTREKAFAEAAGIDKKAEAQKKYQEAGAMAIEVVGRLFDTYRDIEIAKFQNLGSALEKADVRVLSTGEEGQILGIPISAKSGIALGGMLQGAKEAGFDLQGLVKDAVSTARDIITARESEKEKGEKGT